jgi:adenine phosphoribosyltransferase
LNSGANEAVDRIRAAIRDIPDFPKPGIVFKDITPVLSNAELFGTVIQPSSIAIDPCA